MSLNEKMGFFKVLHFLSLDVVLGAVVMHAMFYHFFIGLWPMWEYGTLLGISVFLIYGIDRQIDNHKTQSYDALHAFHAQYRTILSAVFFVLAAINIYLLTRVGVGVVSLGVCLLLVLVGYWYAWVARLFDQFWGVKEVLTAGLYSAGIFLPTAVGLENDRLLFVMWFTVFLLALSNLWLFTWISEGGKRNYVHVLMLLISGLIIGLIAIGINILILSILIMIWGIHAWIYYFRAQMQMRYLGDLAFASPLIYILCQY